MNKVFKSHGMLSLSIVLVLIWSLTAMARAGSPFHVAEEDAKLLVPQLVRKYGYPVEKHQVRTEDGYLLGMFRIPGGRNGTVPGRRPILMMHSWFSSCADWVVIGPGNALGYLLADRGYDIWMGNVRGNRYSRRHERLRVKSRAFWDFSLDEIGYYDVPAMINYVLNRTNARKLHYVGFSQGTIVGLIALTSRPQYNEKIVQLQELSPAIYVYRNPSVIMRTLAFMAKSLAEGYTLFGSFELMSHWTGQYEFYRMLCPSPKQLICRMLIYEVSGENAKQLDAKMLRIFLGHAPAGSSVKQFLHYAQLINDGVFRRYDYEDDRANVAAYGSKQVPRYNLSHVTAPVRTYYGRNDHVVNFRNVKRLERELPNVVSSYLVPDERFGHADFILNKNVKKVVYDEVMRNVEKAEREIG
ncbi:lipase 1 [Culex quinquefasciatus]|uniref:Lipase n=1 Tax=Culex quinquefasciatus TaxID=7176 RepID=B0WNV4_CULQU|nr:lipase 1 [Culex quinquefasciatus]|eukprot:XP_001850388.1 lipase 1 [Culex quinquefasciatus]